MRSKHSVTEQRRRSKINERCVKLNSALNFVSIDFSLFYFILLLIGFLLWPFFFIIDMWNLGMVCLEVGVVFIELMILLVFVFIVRIIYEGMFMCR